MEFSGRLSAFPMGDLLQWAQNERCTGALVVRRSQREKRIYFHAGQVVACLSNDSAEFYGQHLLVQGHLTEEELFRALSHCTERRIRLGAALCELGILSPERVQHTLRQQIEDSVCDMFLWERGVFYYQSEMPPEEEILPEPIHNMGLAMEGARWADEYARIRRVFVHDGMVLRRGTRFPGEDLGPLERRIAAAVDGRKDLEGLYASVRGSYFRFLEAALRLSVEMVLDIDSLGEPGAEEMAASRELSVFDLMLEQAAEEQVLVARRHMAVPLDLLERWYPVWVSEPSAEEQRRIPARARDFYARFDGRTALSDAFSGDPRARGRELDLLMLQLQKGSLALLPAPVERLEQEASRHEQPALQRWWRRIFPQAAG